MLLASLEYHPAMVDIELQAPDLPYCLDALKGRAQAIVSYHDFNGTPSLDELRYILVRMNDAGADICKLVTTARSFEDNAKILKLAHEFRERSLICFAMGAEGRLSRVLSPLAGAWLAFASVEAGNESASGQITAAELRNIYGMITDAR